MYSGQRRSCVPAAGLCGELPSVPRLGAKHSLALRSQAGSAGSDPFRVLIFADDSVVEK